MDDIFQFVLHQQTEMFPLVKTSDIKWYYSWNY